MGVISNNKVIIFLILIILLVILTIPNSFHNFRTTFYNVLRNVSKIQLDMATGDFLELKKRIFTVKYQGIDFESAQLVAKTGTEILKPVNQFLDFSPSEDILVIVYPTMQALNESFGWEGDRSPMGVYWMGTIRVLAPEIWIDEDNKENQALIFKAMGPMIHEYAHLVVDYKTGGNYTRWFTEGVAQYIEKKLTGFTLEEPSGEAKLNIYSFSKLDRDFDTQKDQELAYWQSLLAIEYLADKFDERVIIELLEELGQGKSLNTALTSIIGQDLTQFEEAVRAYCKEQAQINLNFSN